jgi:thioredoxin reductase
MRTTLRRTFRQEPGAALSRLRTSPFSYFRAIAPRASLIGGQPLTAGVEGWLRRDEHGFLMTGPDLLEDGRRGRWWPLERDPLFLESSEPGVFVAGDVRHGSIKRVASAVGEGAMAIALTHRFLSAPQHAGRSE